MSGEVRRIEMSFLFDGINDSLRGVTLQNVKLGFEGMKATVYVPVPFQILHKHFLDWSVIRNTGVDVRGKIRLQQKALETLFIDITVMKYEDGDIIKSQVKIPVTRVLDLDTAEQCQLRVYADKKDDGASDWLDSCKASIEPVYQMTKEEKQVTKLSDDQIEMKLRGGLKDPEYIKILETEKSIRGYNKMTATIIDKIGSK